MRRVSSEKRSRRERVTSYHLASAVHHDCEGGKWPLIRHYSPKTKLNQYSAANFSISGVGPATIRWSPGLISVSGLA